MVVFPRGVSGGAFHAAASVRGTDGVDASLLLHIEALEFLPVAAINTTVANRYFLDTVYLVGRCRFYHHQDITNA